MFKKTSVIACLTIIVSLSFLSESGHSQPIILNGGGEFDVGDTFSLEFYNDANVLYNTSIPFTNMDPTLTWVQADGRSGGDGKSDVGLVCISNMGTTWYLKIHAQPTAPFTLSQIYYYLGQPWNRTLSQTADGQLAQPANWYNLPGSSTVLYTAGPSDLTNTPSGTLCMFSFAINPSKLAAFQTYNCTITYTLTMVP